MTKLGRYRVTVANPQVKKAFIVLPKGRQRAVARAMQNLADDPRPEISKQLRPGESIYRIIIGPDRFTYQVLDDELEVKVTKLKSSPFGGFLNLLLARWRSQR